MEKHNWQNFCSDLVLTANQINGQESFIIEIEAEKIEPLMEVFSGDYGHLINHLKILNDRMVLVNPKFHN